MAVSLPKGPQCGVARMKWNAELRLVVAGEALFVSFLGILA